jgi:NifU-like protein involved in Fe-S cluster formation
VRLDVYPPVVLDHFFNPRGAGRLAPGPGVIEVEVGERRLGAQLEIGVAIVAGRVERAAFRALGCPYLIAAASDLTEWLPGRALPELRAWSWRSQAERLEVPTERYGRLLLVEDALRACCDRIAQSAADP